MHNSLVWRPIEYERFSFLCGDSFPKRLEQAAPTRSIEGQTPMTKLTTKALLIISLLCAVAVSQATILTFEDLSGSGPVPTNYAGLTWINWGYYNQFLPPWNASSGSVRLFPQSDPAIQFGQTVTFVGAWLAGHAFNQYFEGYKNGVKIFESSHIANDGSNFGQYITVNWPGVDEIRSAGNADQIALDDLE